MRVAVLGSWRESKVELRQKYWGLKDAQGFKDACFQLGEQLARSNRLLIVCDDSPESAEYNVVSGVVNVCKNRKPATPVIRVIPNLSSETPPFDNLARQHDGIFATELSDLPKDVPDARLIAVRIADAVALLAGTESTYEAGLIAIINRKRLIPIGSFGGAGSRILHKIGQWRASRLHVPNLIPGPDELAQLAGPWSALRLELVERLLDMRSFLKLLIIYGRSTDWQGLKMHLQDKLNVPEPVVMNEVFGASRALPEKFEQLAMPVHAAIAVITPDDVGSLASTGTGMSMDPSAGESPRARQNVWLEIGWFWGALGRHRILLLKRGAVDIPSDLLGIEYVSYKDDLGKDCAEQIAKFIDSLTTLG